MEYGQIMRNSFRLYACLFAHICYYFYWRECVFQHGQWHTKKEREKWKHKKAAITANGDDEEEEEQEVQRKTEDSRKKNWKELIKIKQSAKNFVSCTIFFVSPRKCTIVSCQATRNFFICLSHRHEWTLRYGTFTAEKISNGFFFVFFYICLFSALVFPRLSVWIALILDEQSKSSPVENNQQLSLFGI